MSAPGVTPGFLLARQEQLQPNLQAMQADDLKQAARFWIDKKRASKLRKAECIAELSRVFHDRARLREALATLPENQRQVLAVCKRYGGAISGPLLLTELLARRLIDRTVKQTTLYRRELKGDPVWDLCALLLLIPRSGTYSRYSYSWDYHREYPDMAVPPQVLDLVETAPPCSWQSSARVSPSQVGSRRFPAEVALDLWTVAQALAQAGTWKTSRSGSLSKSMQNQIRKFFPQNDQDPWLPPDPESLYYEILRGLGIVAVDEDQGSIALRTAEDHLRCPATVQSWHVIRAWLHSRLWQDGIGVVPDRDRYDDPVRIEPKNLHTARELLAWALSAVAHGPDVWLDLETFLVELWSATDKEGISFYWDHYHWNPHFPLARGKGSIQAIEARQRAFWLDDEGVWAANALMVTLAYLGLVERGSVGKGSGSRLCFRLTEVGRRVFAAPECEAEEPAQEARFLTIQPNHDVVVYLNEAEAGTVWPLAQMAQRTSSGSGLAQTFALTRESVYQALESGLSLEAILRFLTEHSRTGVPANVAQSLTEWGRKREALVFRTEVALGIDLPESPSRATRLGDHFSLLSRTAARSLRDYPVRDHDDFARPAWRVNEEGWVSVLEGVDAVTLARLSQFADRDGSKWKISAASVRRANDRGILAEQILGWLHDHLAYFLPPIVETAIRNWSSPAHVFLGDLLLLQVPQAQACTMILSSRQFRPFLLGQVPPNGFIVRPEKRAELEHLLSELGFVVGGAYQMAALGDGDATEARPSHVPSGRRARREQQG